MKDIIGICYSAVFMLDYLKKGTLYCYQYIHLWYCQLFSHYWNPCNHTRYLVIYDYIYRCLKRKTYRILSFFRREILSTPENKWPLTWWKILMVVNCGAVSSISLYVQRSWRSFRERDNWLCEVLLTFFLGHWENVKSIYEKCTTCPLPSPSLELTMQPGFLQVAQAVPVLNLHHQHRLHPASVSSCTAVLW